MAIRSIKRSSVTTGIITLPIEKRLLKMPLYRFLRRVHSLLQNRLRRRNRALRWINAEMAQVRRILRSPHPAALAATKAYENQ